MIILKNENNVFIFSSSNEMKHSNDQQSQCLTEDLRKIEIKKAAEENFPENSDFQKLKDDSDDIIWDYEEILKILGMCKKYILKEKQ